jgi:hypothetical protein
LESQWPDSVAAADVAQSIAATIRISRFMALF